MPYFLRTAVCAAVLVSSAAARRAARVALADAELEVAAAEAFVRRLDIAWTVQRLYVEVQAAEATIDIAKSRVEIAEQLAREVGRRVSEARDPLFAGTRARTQLAEARVDLELASDHSSCYNGNITLP